MWEKLICPQLYSMSFTLLAEQLLKNSYSKFNENLTCGKPSDNEVHHVFQSQTSHIDRMGTMNSRELLSGI